MTSAAAPLRAVPGSIPALIFAGLSVPLAFMGHLVSLATVLALLALVLVARGRWMNARRSGLYSSASQVHLLWALRLGVLGLLLSVVSWILWATGVLPLLP